MFKHKVGDLVMAINMPLPLPQRDYMFGTIIAIKLKNKAKAYTVEWASGYVCEYSINDIQRYKEILNAQLRKT